MSQTRKVCKVRFLLPPDSSRPAQNDEAQVAQAFSRHAGLCHTCQVDKTCAIVVLCARGCRLAEDVQRLLFWKNGYLQSCIRSDERFFSERIELPDRYKLAESFLKATVCQSRKASLLRAAPTAVPSLQVTLESPCERRASTYECRPRFTYHRYRYRSSISSAKNSQDMAGRG